MKVVYFFIILILCMFAMVAIVLIQQPTPLKELPPTVKEQVIEWLTLDKEIHLSFLAIPEKFIYASPYINIGNHKFHQEWADRFEEIIKFIKREPCKYTKEECLELLGKAQASHAGIESCDYAVIKWNYDWFERYAKIIEYVKIIN